MIQVVGPRKSGKTALVQNLIKEFGDLGLEPIVVKQTKHGLTEVDSGDTKRFTISGAKRVVLVCKDGFRYQEVRRVSLKEVVEKLEGLVIVEGGKSLRIREWWAVVTWRNAVERKLYWKPLTVADMGPEDDARLIAWRVARLAETAFRARLS